MKDLGPEVIEFQCELVEREESRSTTCLTLLPAAQCSQERKREKERGTRANNDATRRDESTDKQRCALSKSSSGEKIIVSPAKAVRKKNDAHAHSQRSTHTHTHTRRRNKTSRELPDFDRKRQVAACGAYSLLSREREREGYICIYMHAEKKTQCLTRSARY